MDGVVSKRVHRGTLPARKGDQLTSSRLTENAKNTGQLFVTKYPADAPSYALL